MEFGKLVPEPGDSESLTTTRAVLDEVSLPRTVLLRIDDAPPYSLKLVVPWENKELGVFQIPLIVSLTKFGYEILDDVKDAVWAQQVLPEVARNL